MKKYIVTLIVLTFASIAWNPYDMAAQDTEKKAMINDYMMIGVNYGVTASSMYYNPSKHNRTIPISMNYVAVHFTKYTKMFDTLPLFGIVLGLEHGNSGYGFKVDPETGYSLDIDGANKCIMDLWSIPAMAQIHADFDPGKVMVNIGVYGGWRSSIDRSGPRLDPEWQKKFRPYEIQIDYGLQGGLGFALMFSPIEIHFNAGIRWSWSSLYQPDYASQYYYRYAYPLDFTASVGIHFQLTKRYGKTTKQLRNEAKAIVYGTTEN